MAQTTTSKLIVSLGPPRPSVSFTSTATCATSTISGVTACIGTPLCLTSPQTVVGTAITLDPNGPFLVCTNATLNTFESTTSGPSKPGGIASVSLHHTPLDSSSSGTAGISTPSIASTSPSSPSPPSSPAATQSTNAAGQHASLPSGILIPVFLAWLGIFAAFYPG
ncbi:hypothetical protein DL95DRAFT_82260 [Leptodontidium sp. 2 PMI_412]|nr:hypothetical protein BKA61DRAFT_677041 [Leptodontidium sp. MPI-SDFR-AT-0119]KAH9205850.1 hypothetical protein DL95DRAFT_82260 [Leptodontidium sp. 2 PMI_412]